MKVVSVSPFFNELDLLDLRLDVLQGVVDCHLIVEAPVTYSGLSKPLYFAENKGRYAGHNIAHVVVNDMPFGHNPWERERHQNDCVFNALQQLNADVVIFSDLDEIPRPEAVTGFISSDIPTATLLMDMLIFYFDRLDIHPWHYPKITRVKKHRPIRHAPELPVIQNAGWHFEYMGSKELLLAKINATSHSVESGGRDMWQRVYRGEKPGIERTSPYDINKLPSCVLENIGYWKDKGFFSPNARLP
jgi:hypothetical protein